MPYGWCVCVMKQRGQFRFSSADTFMYVDTLAGTYIKDNKSTKIALCTVLSKIIKIEYVDTIYTFLLLWLGLAFVKLAHLKWEDKLLCCVVDVNACVSESRRVVQGAYFKS